MKLKNHIDNATDLLLGLFDLVLSLGGLIVMGLVWLIAFLAHIFAGFMAGIIVWVLAGSSKSTHAPVLGIIAGVLTVLIALGLTMRDV